MMQRNVYRRRRLVLRDRRPPTLEAERVSEDRDSIPWYDPPVKERIIFCTAPILLVLLGGEAGEAGLSSPSPPLWR